MCLDAIKPDTLYQHTKLWFYINEWENKYHTRPQSFCRLTSSKMSLVSATAYKTTETKSCPYRRSCTDLQGLALSAVIALIHSMLRVGTVSKCLVSADIYTTEKSNKAYALLGRDI